MLLALLRGIEGVDRVNRVTEILAADVSGIVESSMKR